MNDVGPYQRATRLYTKTCDHGLYEPGVDIVQKPS